MKNKKLLRVISALLVAMMLLPMIPADVFSVFKAEAAEITSGVVTTVYPGNRTTFPKDPNDESKYDTTKYDDYKKAVTAWDENAYSTDEGDTTVDGKKIFNIPTDSEAFNYNYSWYSGYKATKDENDNIIKKTIEIVAEHAPVELNSTTKFLAFMQLRLYAYCEGVTNPTLAGYEFKLTKDLDFLNKGWCKFNPNAKFGGTFDGQNHIIGGISMKENGNSISVFGSICGDAVFKNVSIIGSIALGSSPTSATVSGRGVFTNIATISGKTVTVYDVLTALTITDSSTIKIKRSGGLAGYVTGDGNLLVSDIKFSGSITSNGGSIGGIIGSIEESANVQLQRIYCNSKAAVNAVGDNVGGVIGYVGTSGSVTVKDCNNIADDPDTEENEAKVDKEISIDVTVDGGYVGGVIGNISNASAVITLTNVLVDGKIVANGTGNNIGGMIGYCKAGSLSMTDCTYTGDGEKTGFIDATVDSDNVGGLIGNTDSTASVILNNCTVGGSSSDGLKVLIKTYDGTSKVVRNIGGLIGTAGTSTVSMTNCLCNSNTAIYSGQAYNIGLVIGHAAGNNVRLTDTQGKGDIRRSISGDTAPSLLTSNSIVTTYTTANAKTDYYSGVGGIIGRYDGTGTLTLNDCNSSSGVTITTWNRDVGGLIGYATGTVIIDSTDSSGKIVAYNPAVGGFVGYFRGTSLTVRNGSRFRGTIESYDPSGKSFVGGIVGWADNSTVEINGSISGGDITMELNATVVGGFVGYIYYSTVNIESCFTASNIAIIGPTADRAGAVAGMIEGSNGALNINDVLIAGKISVTNGTASSVNAIVPSWNGIEDEAIKMSNSLIVTDMSESGSNSNIFTALYNAGKNNTADIEKDVRNPVCDNVYFVPKVIRQGDSGNPATAITTSGQVRSDSGDEPANVKSWSPANIDKSKLDLNNEGTWVSAGAFVQYPVPAPTKSYANTYFKISEKDISVEAVGKQIQDNGDGTSDHRFVAVVRNYIAGPFGIGFQMTVNYDGLAAPVTQTFYCTKGYKNLNDTVSGTISATLYNADFFVTLTVTDVPNELYDKNLTINITPLIGTETDNGIEKRLGTEAQYVLADTSSEYTYLEVMSFNIQGDIDLYSDVISGSDRQAAVVQEIKGYDPDILGLQEDNDEWESYLKDKLSAWTLYDINVNSTMESECRLFVKDGLAANVVLHGSMPYDGGASDCALTYADVTDKNGSYYLTDAERAFLELYDNTDFLELRSSYNQYNNASHTSYSTVSGGVTWRINGSYSAPTRSMNYVVLLMGDTYVMYVNTHLMHRAQNDKTNGYYSDADNKIYNSPVQKLRSFERQKSIDMLDKKVDEVKAKYANTGKGFEVIITGDMNDYPTTYVGYKEGNPTTKETSLMYERFTYHGYKEAFAVANAAGNFIGGTGTGNAAVSTQKLADLNLDGNRIDYCFYTGTSHLTLLKHEHANGYVIKNGKYLFTSDHRAVISTFRVVYKQAKNN